MDSVGITATENRLVMFLDLHISLEKSIFRYKCILTADQCDLQ